MTASTNFKRFHVTLGWMRGVTQHLSHGVGDEEYRGALRAERVASSANGPHPPPGTGQETNTASSVPAAMHWRALAASERRRRRMGKRRTASTHQAIDILREAQVPVQLERRESQVCPVLQRRAQT